MIIDHLSIGIRCGDGGEGNQVFNLFYFINYRGCRRVEIYQSLINADHVYKESGLARNDFTDEQYG